MFGILDDYGFLYEETFKTIEDARDYVEKMGEEYENAVIVELVPRLKAFIPPKKISWKEY